MAVSLLSCLAAAYAGPVPMFTAGVVPSTPSHPTWAPTLQTTEATVEPCRAFTPILIGDSPQAFVQTPLQAPQPVQTPLLPRVPAEPTKWRVPNPGRLTPIDELPSGFQPLTSSPNRLPVVSIREKAPID